MTARSLGALVPRYERYGLEVSAAAAEVARQRGGGVEIVASRIRDLPSILLQFDVISAVDVIEHVESPLNFVTILADRPKPGGSQIISTGTLDAPAWRFVRGLYWSCGYREHVHHAGLGLRSWRSTGVHASHALRFAYGEPDSCRLGPNAQALLPQAPGGERSCVCGGEGRPHSQGYPSLFEDHMIVSLKKAQA